MDTTYTTLRHTTSRTEPLKSVIANGIWDILIWHVWGVVSVSVSILLIWLNLTQFTIGGEIGRDEDETANVLGGLQVAIHMHGLTISASLFQIARQWIQGSLLNLDRGIPLALVGAERELGLPSFVISHGYLAAVKYAASLWWGPQTYGDLKRKWDVGMVTLFLFVSCILSVLAAPASGILMIPRVQWFFNRAVDFPYPIDGWNTYPYIMVPPDLGYGNYSLPNSVIALEPFFPEMNDGALQYWQGNLAAARLVGRTPDENYRHHVLTTAGVWYVNTTTIWGRSLHDESDTGSSYARSIMHNDAMHGILALNTRENNVRNISLTDYKRAMQRWTQRMYVMNGTGIVTEVNYRYRPKKHAPPMLNPGTAPWCLEDSSGSSPNLMLLSQTSHSRHGQFANMSLALSRVYMAEGPRSETSNKFVNSLQLVFDSGLVRWGNSSDFHSNETRINIAIPTPNVIVCSISTVLTPAMITSFKIRIDGKYVDYSFHDNKILQYHERWLDHVSADPVPSKTVQFASGNATYPSRSMVELVRNVNLQRFGDALNFNDPRKPFDDNPAWLEMAVGGAFVSIFSRLARSTSQYAVGPDIVLPDVIMPEPRIQTPGNKGYTITSYNQGYMFKLPTKVGKLAVALLTLHAAIVLVGSLWQLFWERSVITAWNTVPEYMALGLGSDLPDEVLEKTCAGITAGESLRTIVNIGVTTPEHLELRVGGTGMTPVLGQFEAKYGSRAKRRYKRRNRPKQV